MTNNSTLSAGILYHNAPEMIEWLCKTFGFEKRLIVPGKDNLIIHAHLTLGNASIMISSAENYPNPTFCKSPKETGDVGTAELIVYVEEVDKHYSNTKVNDANIVVDIDDKPYGGRGYCVKDPEGHFWAFSSYNPWA
jgi:uncharacterized glyoxalase superfamily protein PhnB